MFIFKPNRDGWIEEINSKRRVYVSSLNKKKCFKLLKYQPGLMCPAEYPRKAEKAEERSPNLDSWRTAFFNN